MRFLSVAAGFAAVFACVGGTFAQGSGTAVDPSPSRFMVRAPDLAAVEDRWAQGLGVAQWWVNKIAENRLRSGIQSISNAAVQEATEIVLWTGQGVLFELRVAKSERADEAGWFLATVVGGKAHKAGVGSTPEQALFSRFSTDYWQTGIPAGYTVDPVYSGFFWVAKGAKGQLEAKVVARGTVNGLVERMRSSYGDLELKYQSEKVGNKEAWVQLARTAKARLADQAAKRAVDSALRVVLDSQARVVDINDRLRRALEKEAAAARTLGVLQILKTVFDVAQLVQVAITETGEPASRFGEAKTPEAVLRTVEEIQTESITIRKETEVRFGQDSVALQDALDKLWGRAVPANPPQDARDALLLKRSP